MPEIFEVPVHYRANIDARFVDSLERYFNQHIETGGFLRALMENDLHRVIKIADPGAWHQLPTLLDLLLECAPDKAWGNKEKVKDWLAK